MSCRRFLQLPQTRSLQNPEVASGGFSGQLGTKANRVSSQPSPPQEWPPETPGNCVGFRSGLQHLGSFLSMGWVGVGWKQTPADEEGSLYIQ